MKVTLTGKGYEVDDAKDGDAALEKLSEERFDLILLDMSMPGMGGRLPGVRAKTALDR
jgi:CheY-like chemotaxis protein